MVEFSLESLLCAASLPESPRTKKNLFGAGREADQDYRSIPINGFALYGIGKLADQAPEPVADGAAPSLSNNHLHGNDFPTTPRARSLRTAPPGFIRAPSLLVRQPGLHAVGTCGTVRPVEPRGTHEHGAASLGVGRITGGTDSFVAEVLDAKPLVPGVVV